jgi:hypothetical protein
MVFDAVKQSVLSDIYKLVNGNESAMHQQCESWNEKLSVEDEIRKLL